MTGREPSGGLFLTIVRAIGLLIAVIGMVGFGVCGIFGVGVGALNIGDVGMSGLGIIGLGILGLLIAYAFFVAARGMLRSWSRK